MSVINLQQYFTFIKVFFIDQYQWALLHIAISHSREWIRQKKLPINSEKYSTMAKMWTTTRNYWQYTKRLQREQWFSKLDSLLGYVFNRHLTSLSNFDNEFDQKNVDFSNSIPNYSLFWFYENLTLKRRYRWLTKLLFGNKLH